MKVAAEDGVGVAVVAAPSDRHVACASCDAEDV